MDEVRELPRQVSSQAAVLGCLLIDQRDFPSAGKTKLIEEDWANG